MQNSKVIIIGAGPAGMAAAVQLKRYGISPLVFESKRAGGLLWNANLVENYPGFPNGISGPALVSRMIEQFAAHQLEIIGQKVLSVDFHDGGFVVETKKADYASQAVLVATGTKANHFPDNFIPEQVKDRVCYEVADLDGVIGEQILIIGAGDAAFDYALNLAKDNEVVIINKGSEIKALPLLHARVNDHSRIRYMENTQVRSLCRQQGGIAVQLDVPDGGFNLSCGYLLGAIGRSPSAPAFSERLKLEMKRLQKAGFLQIIGDVKNGIYRQTSIAVGDGVMAAMKIYGKI